METPTVQPSPDSNGIVWDSQPAQPATQSGPDTSGIVWDKQPIQPVQTSPASAPQSNEITINPSDSLLTKAGKTVSGLFEGVGEGALSTITGTDDWARQHLPAFMTNSDLGFGAPANLEHVKEVSGSNGASHGIPQSVGRGAEDIAEFILGDSALKGLTVSQRLATATKYAKLVEDSPVISRIVNAGIRALRTGTVAGTETGLKTGNASDAATSGVVGGVTAGVVPEAIDAGKAAVKALPGALDTIRTAIKPGIIQDAFQGRIRDIVNDAAKEFGVNPSSATSIRDVAQEVSNSLQSKAKASYQALDDATGGRVQRFSDAIKAVQQKLRNLNGIQTPDDEGAWIEKLNDLTDAHEKAMQEAESQGVPRSLLDQANGDFRKSKAMLDVSRAVRSSSEGLRPELATGAKNPIPETVNTGKLFNRVQKLYDSGRLQDALGQSRAADMLRAVNDSHAASQLAESVRGMVKKYGGYAAGAALPVGGFELVKHLLGE
jgi:hypothetical protein